MLLQEPPEEEVQGKLGGGVLELKKFLWECGVSVCGAETAQGGKGGASL